MGAEIHLNMIAGGRPVIARVSPRCKVADGAPVDLLADLTGAHLFDPATEMAIVG